MSTSTPTQTDRAISTVVGSVGWILATPALIYTGIKTTDTQTILTGLGFGAASLLILKASARPHVPSQTQTISVPHDIQ